MLCIFLLGAGWTDAADGKVRNIWIIGGMAPGMILNGRDFITAALVILIPSYLLFRMRVMGAGDGKLMALIAGYLGVDEGLKCIEAGMVIGAAWAILRLWQHRNNSEFFTYLTAGIRRIIHVRKENLTEYGALSAIQKKHTIPLAVCLTAGTYAYLFVSRLALIGREII